MGVVGGGIVDVLGSIFGSTAAADVGIGAAADAAAGAAATEVGLGTAGALAADTAALSTVGDAALGTLAASEGTAALGATAGLGAAGAADAATGLGSSALGATSAGTAALPEVTVTGTAPGASALGSTLGAAGTGAATALGSAAAGGGSPAATSTSAQPADFSGGGGDLSPGSFLPATSGSDIGSLSPDLASQFGVAPPSTSFDPSLQDVGNFDPNSAFNGISDNPTANFNPADLNATGGGGIMNWLKNPKNLAQAGLLGISGVNALSKPKLPSAANMALGAAGPAVQQAESVIQSGGTATAEWSAQKASIDATIDQQIKQQTEALMQSAASSGEGNQNSGIVQQQIQQMTTNANVQRQQLYLQAQQQNVNNAVSELTGANQTLTSIANMQMAEEAQARQTALQTASLAAQLTQLFG